MEDTKKEQSLREVAIKTSIKELLFGEFFLDKEGSKNYLLTVDGEKLFRLSIMATIVNKEKHGSITNILVDDGTEKIILRLFEENKQSNVSIGDTLLVIGKIRMYNQEKYISPEIIKKINPLWLKVRSLEIKKKTLNKLNNIEIFNVYEQPVNNKNIKLDDAAEKNFETISSTKMKNIDLPEKNNHEKYDDYEDTEIDFSPTQKIKNLIIELDTGNGVLIEDIIECSLFEDTEELIENMLEKGDIFQNTPGKVKVL